jgi:hypothetical protein
MGSSRTVGATHTVTNVPVAAVEVEIEVEVVAALWEQFGTGPLSDLSTRVQVAARL